MIKVTLNVALSELGCVFVKLSIYWDFFMAISSVYRERSEKEGEKTSSKQQFLGEKAFLMEEVGGECSELTGRQQ